MAKMLTDETQIGFHTLCGKRVMLSLDNLTAKREGDTYDNGLCFTGKPLKIGNVFQVKIQEMDLKWIGCLVSLMCSHYIHAISALVIAGVKNILSSVQYCSTKDIGHNIRRVHHLSVVSKII